ncbi:DUF5683 domain-containing protein [Tenacibaculum maritimum]|uniref:DUF5683 domain-containing protein n=1 Tax=Tenacibaculum maritimum TaxID=107401 RepID=UPI0012E4009F|nr:DUF5683 domain-containing protein [Tenacibaculum maritimum]CAA0234467.1 conserved exported hypothetical protein [Tenacibaculum maritimum]
MLTRSYIVLFCFSLLAFSSFAQKKKRAVKQPSLQLNSNDYNPLSPSKAAFYSAIFPGGGQIYNKKYWKAPIVWAAIGTSIYFYIDNSNEYDRYRTAFKLRKQNLRDEFTDANGRKLISDAGLENAQKTLRKNRDLSLLTGTLLYVLQIIEASVNAHLLQFNTNDNLSLNPTITTDPLFVETPKIGLRLNYSF